jgi:hypothetical protein
MTEFEIASLELMNFERIKGIAELMQGQGSLIASDGATFTSLLFGYLLAAYFIGVNLSRVQGRWQYLICCILRAWA